MDDRKICGLKPEMAAYMTQTGCRWRDLSSKNPLNWQVDDSERIDIAEATFNDIVAIANRKINEVVRAIAASPTFGGRAQVTWQPAALRRGVLGVAQVPCPSFPHTEAVWSRLNSRIAWSANTAALVAIHEGLHTLGLGHAPQQSASIMAPAFDADRAPEVETWSLWEDDWAVGELQRRYPWIQPNPGPDEPPDGDDPQPPPPRDFDGWWEAIPGILVPFRRHTNTRSPATSTTQPEHPTQPNPGGRL